MRVRAGGGGAQEIRIFFLTLISIKSLLCTRYSRSYSTATYILKSDG